MKIKNKKLKLHRLIVRYYTIMAGRQREGIVCVRRDVLGSKPAKLARRPTGNAAGRQR